MRPVRHLVLVVVVALLASSCSGPTVTAAQDLTQAAPTVPAVIQTPAAQTAPTIEPIVAVTPTAPPATVDPAVATVVAPADDTAQPTSPLASDSDQVERFDNPVLELMATIAPPADGKGFYGEATNYQGMFAEAGIDPASLCGDKTAYRNALIEALSGQRTAGTLFFNPYSDKSFYDIDDIERSFGFSFCDINAIVSARLPTIAVHVDVDAAEVVAAAQADERWADLLEVSEEPDLTILDWSRDPLATFGRPLSSMFPFGIPPMIAVSGSAFVRTSEPAGLQHIVDPTTPSLLETGSIRATVEAIIAEGAHQFHFSNQPYGQNALAWLSPVEVFDGDGLSEQAQAAVARSQLGLPLWTSLAMGITRDGDKQVGLVVMSHLSETDATESAVRFEAMLDSGADQDGNLWSESYQLRAIRTDGLLMIAKLEITDQVTSLNRLVRPYMFRDILYAVGDDPAAE